MAPTAGPIDLTRRRRRLSDEETARRMIDRALEIVNVAGMTVSLDHISFEDVIRDAQVSRTAAYRRWPYKHLFFIDLLKEVAHAAAPAAAVDAETGRAAMVRVLHAHRDRLGTARGRHRAVSELIRLGAVGDFEAIYRSAAWRTYLALHATFVSLADGELRDEVEMALRDSERGFIDRIARSWELVATALGYRLRPGTGATYETIATLATAALRGLVTMALSDPGIATRRVRADPTGTGVEQEWSLVGLGAASIAMAYLEPDPRTRWSRKRLEALL